MNAIYISAMQNGYLKYVCANINVNIRTMNTIFSIVSCALFFFAMRGLLYNTFKKLKDDEGNPSWKKTVYQAFAFGGITLFFNTALYRVYNFAMTYMYTPLGGDVQRLGSAPKMQVVEYGSLLMRYVFSLLNEELLIVAMFFTILAFLDEKKIWHVLIAMSGSLLIFGALHCVAWNFAAIPAVIMSKLPACLLFLYWKDIKPLYLAHFANNAIVTMMSVQGFSLMMQKNAYYVFFFPLFIYLTFHTLRDVFFFEKDEEEYMEEDTEDEIQG